MRILAISPRFAPTNGADTHRLRLLLAHSSTSGWEVEVLAVDSTDVVGPTDPWLEKHLPIDVPIHRVRAWQLKGWGLNGLAQRSFMSLYRRGCDLLATGRFDLVFFSTTEFALHMLGPLWKRKFGVPFCMDYQDPWVNDYYHTHPEIIPPGGRFKYAIVDRLHRIMERHVVRSCSGYMAVSQAYLTDLANRYGAAVAQKPTLVAPFPAEPNEINLLRLDNTLVNNNGSHLVWRYIGRGGADMNKAASAFFHAWNKAIAEGNIAKDGVDFEAYGTSYASAGKGEKTFEPLVAETELALCVKENPDRLGYSHMLRMLLQSDALIVFGSDDPAYTASKIYPYLLSEKPLLTIFHECSPIVSLMNTIEGEICVTFNEKTTIQELATTIYNKWFKTKNFKNKKDINKLKFSPFTAKHQANEIKTWFRQIKGKSK